MVIVKVDIYNRIQKWTLSLMHTGEALDLYEYIIKKRLQHFERQAIEGLLPMKIIHTVYNVTLDIVPIYFMQVFGTGHGVEGKMSSNTSDEIQNIRNEMIKYVCEELDWSKNDWDAFYNPMYKNRNQIVAHFDATAVNFSEDGGMHSYKTALSVAEDIKRLRIVVTLMKKFLSGFKHPNTAVGNGETGSGTNMKNGT